MKADADNVCVRKLGLFSSNQLQREKYAKWVYVVSIF